MDAHMAEPQRRMMLVISRFNGAITTETTDKVPSCLPIGEVQGTLRENAVLGVETNRCRHFRHRQSQGRRALHVVIRGQVDPCRTYEVSLNTTEAYCICRQVFCTLNL